MIRILTTLMRMEKWKHHSMFQYIEDLSGMYFIGKKSILWAACVLIDYVVLGMSQHRTCQDNPSKFIVLEPFPPRKVPSSSHQARTCFPGTLWRDLHHIHRAALVQTIQLTNGRGVQVGNQDSPDFCHRCEKRFQPNAYARKKRDEKDSSSLEKHFAEVVVRAGRSGGKNRENLNCEGYCLIAGIPNIDSMIARCIPSYCSAKVRGSTWGIPAICPKFQPNFPRLSSSLPRFRNS